MEEKREGWNRRQIDLIERQVSEILKVMNGNGKIGLNGKVDIMWGYRMLFIGLFSVNILSLIVFTVYLLKGG